MAYAIEATILDEELRMVRDNGGQAVCDFSDDNRRGGSNAQVVAFPSCTKVYKDRSCASVIVSRCGDVYAMADMLLVDEGACM